VSEEQAEARGVAEATGTSDADGAARARRPSGRGIRPDPLASRGLKWGAATATYVAVVLAVLVAINLVGSKIPTTWDLTAGHRLTLTAASRNILAGLRQPVQILAFERPGDRTASQVETLLRQYAADSHGLVTYKVVDPAADRQLAVQYGVNEYGTVVVTSESNSTSVAQADMTTYTPAGTPVFDGESAITNAILRVAQPVHFTVDFLTGDGEPDISAGDLPDAVQALKDQGYTVQQVNLLTTPSVSPKDVAAILLVSPQHDLSASEINALRTYAEAGGHLVVLLDPMTKPLTNLDALLSSWGITPQNSLVVDAKNHYGNDPTQVVATLTQSDITAPLQRANLGVLFIGAQGLDVAKSVPGYVVTPILTTSSPSAGGPPTSWAIRDLASLRSHPSLAYDPKRDTPGPITLAATVMEVPGGSAASGTSSSAASGSGSGPSDTTAHAAPIGQKQFRAVVFGNSLFIASSATGQPNGPINVQGNRNLFLNAVAWATGLSEGIAVRPQPGTQNTVFLTGQTTRTLMDTFILGVPLVCFALAASTWWARRRL
jgi:ABC-type uncharacterized transport system involved in gliding motility auxiliary subunit